MHRRRNAVYNQKRRVADAATPDERDALASRVSYGGNPEHKKAPGDFELHPPAIPRPDKSLCDAVRVWTRAEAEQLLKDGVRRGLVSDQRRGDYPQNVWSVTHDGEPVEAQLENSVRGSYHGYPMPESDPFRWHVLDRWNST